MWIWAGCALISVLLLFGIGIFVAISLLNDDGDKTSSLPETWPSNDAVPVRQVPMPTGEMVVALPGETSAQAICQALPESRWEELLGGKTLREVRPTGGCHVVTAELDVRAGMIRALPTDSIRKTSVAGRDAIVKADSEKFKLGVELVKTETGTGADPVLYVEIESADYRSPLEPHKPEEKATALAEALIAGLMPPGPKLPEIGKDGEIAPKAVEPGSIVDAPLPMISWQLCAHLGRALSVPAEQTKPQFFASCGAGSVTADYHEHAPSTDAQATTTIAGLQAVVDGKNILVRLTDDPRGKALEFSGEGDLRGIAEKLVPPLLGR